MPGDPEGAAVLCLHGYGANFKDLIALSQVYRPRPRLTWYFPNGPLEIPFSADYTGRAWFEIRMDLLQKAVQQGEKPPIEEAFPTELDSIRLRLQSLLFDLGKPPSQLFVGGFSQGGVLATDLALHLTDNLAGLLIFSSTLLYQERLAKLAPLHAGMPFFQSHGERDPLLPLSGARALEKLLVDSGLKGELVTFQGGHEIPQKVFIALHHFFDRII